MPASAALHLAYTPDSHNAFYYDALEAGRVRLAGYPLQFRRAPVSALNAEALHGRFEVTTISSVLYPCVADRYAILATGTAVGRGYGPILVAREPCIPSDLDGKRVGVGGIPTTGWFLLRLFCPDAIPVAMPFDAIAAAVAGGELDAGVMIHEELLYYPRLGLRRVLDLGAAWCRRHDLPLPVGLNVVRRDLGPVLMRRVAAAIRASLRHALARPREAIVRVSRFGRGPDGGCAERLVSMFANYDSLHLGPDVRVALRTLFREVVDLGLADAVPGLDVVEALAPEVDSCA